MNGIGEKIKNFRNGEFAQRMKAVLSSKYLSFVTALVVMICYYAALDIAAMYYLSALYILMLIFLDDLSPLIANFLFMCVLISDKNSPSNFLAIKSGLPASDFYEKTYVVAQIGALIALISSVMIYRLVKNIVQGKFRRDSMFYGLAAFAVVLVLNGAFCEDYSAKDFAYGLCLAGLFFGVFTVIKDNVEINGENLKTISFGFVAFAALITAELFFKYVSNGEIIVDGVIDRESIGFGWGMYNTVGAYLLLCAPFPFYLSTKYKYGFGFFILGLLFLAATILTFSRQAWGGAAVVYSVCVIATLIKEKGKNKLIEISITVCVVLVALVMAFVYWSDFVTLIKNLFNGIFSGEEFTGNGRKKLWERAIEDFKANPVFGAGFFVDLWAPDFDGLSFVPEMYHNTYMQLLGSCGIAGLLGYAVHRGTTIFSFLKNITFERILIAVDVLGLLTVSLVDNHLFYLFPTMIYSCLMVMLVRSENHGVGLKPIDAIKRKFKKQAKSAAN